jgi:hypothetical protein
MSNLTFADDIESPTVMRFVVAAVMMLFVLIILSGSPII